MIELSQDTRFASLRARLPAGTAQLVDVSFGALEVSDDLPLYGTTGASIAVCLIDQNSGTVGLCHVLLPSRFGHHREDAMLKADCALEALNNRLLEVIHGQRGRPKIGAKLFGGADLDAIGAHSQQSAGFCRNWLRTRGIAILNDSIGGHVQREIVLLPACGTAYCRQAPLTVDVLEAERDALLAVSAPTQKIELF